MHAILRAILLFSHHYMTIWMTKNRGPIGVTSIKKRVIPIFGPLFIKTTQNRVKCNFYKQKHFDVQIYFIFWIMMYYISMFRQRWIIHMFLSPHRWQQQVIMAQRTHNMNFCQLLMARHSDSRCGIFQKTHFYFLNVSLA